jgi:hypothetical protein
MNESFNKILVALKEASQRQFDNIFRLERETLMGELCQHLRTIGVNAVMLEPDNPEAYRYPPYVLGCSKIEGRNTDMLLVQTSASGGGDSEGGPDTTFAIYRYFYVVRANVDGLETTLKADFKSNWHDRCCKKRNFTWIDKKILTDKEVSDCRWEGGELAQLLNADTELTITLYSEGLDRLEIRPDRGRRCVRIEHWHWKAYSSRDVGSGDLKNVYDSRPSGGTYLTTTGRKQFPTRDSFEAHERIAYTIRRIALTNPLNSSAGM